MDRNTYNRNYIAVILMLVGTVAWSTIPLIVDKANGRDNPFIFNTMYTIFASVGIFFYLLLFHRRQISGSNIWSTVYIATRRRSPDNASDGDSRVSLLSHLKHIWESQVFLLAAVGRLSILCLAWSTSYIDVAVSAILYETWVIWFIILRNWNSPDRVSGLGGQTWLLIIIGLIGLGYVNLSRSEISENWFDFGTILALIGGLLAAVNVERSLKWGENVRKAYFEIYDNDGNDERDSHNLELVFTMVGVVTLNLLASVVTLAIGIVYAIGRSGEGVWFDTSEFLWISVGGAIAGTFALVLFRKANIITKFPEVNAISYLAPALSVVALIAFSKISLQRYDYFILGTSVLVAVNILINFTSSEQSSSFNWLIMALWGSGMFVLLRDEWLDSWLPGDWIWEIEVGEYFTLIGLSATVYILVLSFRRSRVSALTDREELLAFSIFERLRRIDDDAAQLVQEIDMSGSRRQLQVKLSKIKALLESSSKNISESEEIGIHQDLNFLVYSKIKGRELTEPIVLVLFAIITIAMTLTTRPEFRHSIDAQQMANWTGFLVDFFAALFSAALVFLTVNLFDLWKERKSSVFGSIEPASDETVNRHFDGLVEQVISIVLAFGMAIVVFVLLYGKWMSFWW